MPNLVVKVKREAIAACITCPLCNKLLKDATTISECLHSFCKKCIHEKISEDDIECCPVCDIDLGGAPLEKLRPDHSLQDLRAKIFPRKNRPVKEPDVIPSATLPTRRKERSISSLVVSTPRVTAQAGMSVRRTKPQARKDAALRGSTSSAEKPVKREESSAEDHPGGASSPETLSKFTQIKRQSLSFSEPNEPISNKKVEGSAEPLQGKSDLWKSLNCLVEVASRSKSSKSSSQGSDSKSEPTQVLGVRAQVSKTKIRETKCKPRVQDETNGVDPTTSETPPPKKLSRIRQKRREIGGDSVISFQTLLDAGSAKRQRRTAPLWFSLVASDDQGAEANLPQIPAKFLTIKDGSIPVSFIQKYLMKKLNLTNEDEVVIKCMGQTIVPSLELYDLVDTWLQSTATSERIPAFIGSSAKDFVMVLSYSRKLL